MASPTTSHLSPDDAAVAVRSFPRRFRALLIPPSEGDERADPDELGRRPGPDGHSAVEHLLAADGVLATADQVLERSRHAGEAAAPAVVSDLGAVWIADPGSPVGALLDQLAGTAGRCADRIDAVPVDDWGRSLRIGDGDATRELLDVVRDAVDVTAAHLRAAERTIQAVR